MSRMARVFLVIFACLVTLTVKAQVGSISGQVVDQNGKPLPSALIRVCSATSTGTPCSPTTPIFADYGLTIPLSNPTSADQYGNYTFFVPSLAAPNLYTIQYSPNSGITWQYVKDGPVNGAPTIQACNQVGADAGLQIIAAAAQLPARGGAVDATCYGGTSQVVGEQLTALANPTGSRPISLLLNPSTLFTFTYQFPSGTIAANIASHTSGMNGACMVPVGNGSSIITPGLNSLNGTFILGPSSATYDLVCNSFQDGTQESLLIDGLSVEGNATATMSGSLLHLVQLFSETKIENFTTYYPFGNGATISGGGPYVFFNDNFIDGYPYAGGTPGIVYAGAVLTLNCLNHATFTAGSVQDNSQHNPALVMQNCGTDHRTPVTSGGYNNVSVHFDNEYFELETATVGTFPGAPTNVDPIQILDPEDVMLNGMQVFGTAGGGSSNQQNLIDIIGSTASEPKGPVDIDAVITLPQWAGLCLINNTVGSPWVTPTLACVKGQSASGSTIYGVAKYRWAGGGQTGTNGGMIDYEDYKNFSSVVSGITNGAYSVGVNYPSIQSAVTGAGTNGSLLIPPNYQGTDFIASNTANIRVDDQRPFNPTNSTTYISGPMPQTTIKASEYGAVCNGTQDDYPAIQAAVNASVEVVGILQTGAQPMHGGTVELPQGHCLTSQPIMLYNYGSLLGSSNGTWLSPAFTWSAPAGSAMVNIVQTYDKTKYLSQLGTSANRYVKGINFYYNGSTAQITGLKIFNQTGTQTTPYPNGSASNPQSYQIPYVTVEGNYFYAMDMGIDAEDCGNCLFLNNNIFAVRVGIYDGGNNYSLVVQSGSILDGSYSYTTVKTGGTSGVYSVSEVRYSCTGGTGASCAGGSIGQNVVASPQGLSVENVTFESFDIDSNIINCLGYISNNSGYDSAGVAMYLGQLKFAQLYYNFMAINGGNANDVIQVAALTGSQGSGLSNGDGLWLQGNFIYAYNPTTGAGIDFLSGGVARRNVYVTDNQFTSVGNAVNVQSPLTYSVLSENYGNTITGALFNFPLTAASSYANTVLRDNTMTSTGKIYNAVSGTGLVVGYNSSGNPTSGGQLTGTQIATGAGCSVAGGIGNSTLCPITIPNQYIDNNYKVTGCQVSGASAQATTGLSLNTNGSTFSVYEVALSTTAVTGGTITCSVTDQ